MADEKTGAPPMPKGQSAPKHVVVGQYPPPDPTSRRTFLSWAAAAWGTFGVANLVGGAACLRFMLPNVLFEPPMKFKAGKLDDYEWDKPSETYKISQKCWVMKTSSDYNKKPTFFALDTTCTHLGCTPNVLFAEQKIKCPCHGSGFRFSGVNFEGPAPRPLERYKVYIDPVDGLITIDRNKKYHYEKGEWEDRESFIDLSGA